KGAYTTAPVEKPQYRHGDAAHPTTIWYWNAGSVDPPIEPQATLLDATGPDNDLIARPSNSDLVARGKWEDGRWRVLLKRPRNSNGSPDLVFRRGQFIPVSFANWDGNNGEVGSRHTLTTWFWLLLPLDTNYIVVRGIPLGITFGTFLAGILVVRTQRRKQRGQAMGGVRNRIEGDGMSDHPPKKN
ncbi:MAG: ethylbenzene dehydrogenase-related protein, partial [Acidiferrobacterales bacterium]